MGQILTQSSGLWLLKPQIHSVQEGGHKPHVDSELLKVQTGKIHKGFPRLRRATIMRRQAPQCLH